MYVIGKLHRWVNQTGELEHLNGTECTVTGPPRVFIAYTGKRFYGQMTDTPSVIPDHLLAAERGDLVPVDPPSGERSVLAWFRVPEVETA